VHVVNTCTVTGRADFSDRQAIRRIARDNPTRVVVTGCYARRCEAVARIPAWTWWWAIRRSIDGRPPRRFGKRRTEIRVGDVRTSRGVPSHRSPPGGALAGVRQDQDGCQHRCAFCIVRRPRRQPQPGARRRAEQVEALVDAGYREITLTGVDIGHTAVI